MDLILWRHAEAEDGFPDLGRELTARGRKQAKRVGAWLAARLPREARVLASPAARARQTAAGLGRPFETNLDIAPGASAEDVLAAAGWPEDGGTVLVVGHQPTLGLVVARLLHGEERCFALKKGGLVWLRHRQADGVLLKGAITPDLV